MHLIFIKKNYTKNRLHFLYAKYDLFYYFDVDFSLRNSTSCRNISVSLLVVISDVNYNPTLSEYQQILAQYLQQYSHFFQNNQKIFSPQKTMCFKQIRSVQMIICLVYFFFYTCISYVADNILVFFFFGNWNFNFSINLNIFFQFLDPVF